jgi:hypothetical protein
MTGQEKLFTVAVDERRLPDVDRTVLHHPASRPGRLPADPDWLRAAGFRVLARLRRDGLVRRPGRADRWTRLA